MTDTHVRLVRNDRVFLALPINVDSEEARAAGTGTFHGLDGVHSLRVDGQGLTVTSLLSLPMSPDGPAVVSMTGSCGREEVESQWIR